MTHVQKVSPLAQEVDRNQASSPEVKTMMANQFGKLNIDNQSRRQSQDIRRPSLSLLEQSL